MEMEQFRQMLMGKADIRALSGEERIRVMESMQPITDLRPGDKVVWKGCEYKNSTIPAINEVVEVAAIISPPRMREPSGNKYDTEYNDFSVLFQDTNDGEYIEYLFDSRRFKRA